MQLLATLDAFPIEVALEIAFVRIISWEASFPFPDQSLFLLLLLVAHFEALGPTVDILRPAILQVALKKPIIPLVEGTQFIARVQGMLSLTLSDLRLIPGVVSF